MNRTQAISTIGFVVLVGAVAFVLTRERGQLQGNTVDIGEQNEVMEQGSVLEEKIDEQGAVTVKVQPKEVSPSATPWEFEITLDTHSVELDDDLVAQSVLVDTQGNEYRPVSWEGDPPGGHHRKGILKFPSLPQADVIQLKIHGIGGVEQRTYEWQL